MNNIFALLVMLALNASLVLADGLQIVHLQHRLAQELIPIIQPMLAPDDAISGQGYQLFIRTSEANMAQVRQMIGQLDRAPKMLLISVFQGTAGELRSLGVAGHINYQYRRDGKVSDMTGSSASLKLLGSTSHHANQATQQLRVVDGGEGYIETGESLPMVFHGYRGRFGSQGASITYRDSLSGFYVRPRLRGEWVNLDISPHWEQTSQVLGGAFETASASTSIRGPLGQWLPIGGVGQQRHNNLVDMTSIMTTGEQQDRQMWIKVERVE